MEATLSLEVAGDEPDVEGLDAGETAAEAVCGTKSEELECCLALRVAARKGSKPVSGWSCSLWSERNPSSDESASSSFCCCFDCPGWIVEDERAREGVASS